MVGNGHFKFRTNMKKINYKALLLFGVCLLGYTACEDPRNEHLEDYQTLFYFRNAGEQSVTLYKIGENSVYDIPVCKAGRNITSTGEVTVSAMDQAQMDIYNLANETDYAILPETYYKFISDSKMTFGADDRYKIAKVEMDTDRISELQQSAKDKTYVLALQLHADAKVSDNGNLLIINPTIQIPTLTFSRPGLLELYYTSASPEHNEYSNNVVLDMDNRWDFSCELKTRDQQWLDEYNSTNGTEYVMMPDDMYTFPSKSTFATGSNRSEFKVSIDRTKMELLKEYALPVHISSCTRNEFFLDAPNANVLYMARLDPDKVELTENMIDSPFTHVHGTDGQGIPGLCDGDTNTYWQSEWGAEVTTDQTYGIYIDFSLPEPLSSIIVKYCTRNSTYTNNIPQGIVIGASNDKENWTVIGEVMSGLPTKEMTWATLPVMSSKTSFRYIRFGIAVTANGDMRGRTDWISTNLGEIEIQGINLVD